MSVSTPLVSIIIAAHNRPTLLGKTLDSIERLLYPNLQIIIIDDGSTIPIRPIIERWRDTSVCPGLSLKTLRQPNMGPAAARNAGVELSQGELILFMDDDDLIAADAVGYLVQAIENPQAPEIAMGSYRLQYDTRDGSRTGETLAPPNGDTQARLSAMIGGHWFVPIHGYLFTRAAIELIGPWDCMLSSQEDDELLLRAALARLPFRRAPEALVYYRQHNGVRRATPGKPDATLLAGRIKRLHCDLTIREQVYCQLRQRGLLNTYRAAFSTWKKRLAQRYGDLFEMQQAALEDSALLNWLANSFNALGGFRVSRAPVPRASANLHASPRPTRLLSSTPTPPTSRKGSQTTSRRSDHTGKAALLHKSQDGRR